MLSLPEPRLLPFCKLEVEVGAPQIIGPGRFGERRVIPILGGRVSGDKIAGKILPGADWQTVTPDGLVELDARYTFQTGDGAIVELTDYGFRYDRKDAAGNPAPPYMRTTARLETGHPSYSWVNRMMFVGAGGKAGTTVYIHLYSVE